MIYHDIDQICASAFCKAIESCIVDIVINIALMCLSNLRINYHFNFYVFDMDKYAIGYSFCNFEYIFGLTMPIFMKILILYFFTRLKDSSMETHDVTDENNWTYRRSYYKALCCYCLIFTCTQC